MKNIAIIIGAISITALLIGTITFPYWTSAVVEITVSDKERVVQGSGDAQSSKYLIFTEAETFQNSDCLRWFKFNSSDVYGNMKKGETYTVSVYGWRVPFLSMYRNIVRVKAQIKH